jgi:hypothetical protein
MKGIFHSASIRTGYWRLVASVGILVFGIGASRVVQAQEIPTASEPAPSDAAPAEIAPADDSSAAANVAAAPPVISSELAEAIRQLDDDEYAVRQSAQRQLTKIGGPALELTAQVAASGSLESSTRAVNVLWKWAESSDTPLNRLALEKIAALANRPVEAAEARRRLDVLLENEAIAKLLELGAHIEADRAYGTIGIVGANVPLQVVIRPGWKGGVDGLKLIADVKRATTLSLWSAPLGDEALPELEKLGNVRRIELYGVAMNHELIDRSREKLPNTIVEVRPGGARLGIRGLNAQEIVPNSPAAKAGLVVNDLITEFGGKPIKTFEDLTGEIAKCTPGDTVEIKFKRGTEERTAKVTFDRWGDDLGAAKPMADAAPADQGLFGPMPRAIPARALPRVQIERRPLGLPREAPGPVDPALPR